MLAEDVCQFLSNAGLGTYDPTTVGGDIFLMRTAPGVGGDDSDDCIMVRSTGGQKTLPAITTDRPSIQVIVRGTRFDPEPAESRAQAIYDALNGFRNAELVPGGTFVIFCQGMQSGPHYIGVDANDRHEFSTNFDFWIMIQTGGHRLCLQHTPR